MRLRLARYDQPATHLGYKLPRFLRYRNRCVLHADLFSMLGLRRHQQATALAPASKHHAVTVTSI